MAASQEERFRPATFSLPATTGTLWVPLLPCVLGKSSKIPFLHYPKKGSSFKPWQRCLPYCKTPKGDSYVPRR